MRIRKYINVDILVEKIYDSACEHPTVEQLFIAMAVKHLTKKQKQVWELHQFDRLTQDEIATKLGKARTTVLTQIRQAEARIKRWCVAHVKVYEVLKARQRD